MIQKQLKFSYQGALLAIIACGLYLLVFSLQPSQLSGTIAVDHSNKDSFNDSVCKNCPQKNSIAATGLEANSFANTAEREQILAAGTIINANNSKLMGTGGDKQETSANRVNKNGHTEQGWNIQEKYINNEATSGKPYLHSDTTQANISPLMRGTQEMKKIPITEDPMALALLRHAEVEEAPSISNSSTPSEVFEGYKALTGIDEKVAYLNQIEQTNRPDKMSIYQQIFSQENNATVMQEILTLAMDMSNDSSVADIIKMGLLPTQDVNVRLASLYYAQSVAPELIAQYVNDSNPLVRDEAKGMQETR